MTNGIVRGMNTRTDFYVYVMFREDGTPFYVGKGRGSRITEHEREATRTEMKERRHNIIRRMIAGGIEVPKVKLHEGLTETVAFEYERALIAAIGRADLGRGSLANKTDGGDGASGRKLSDETLAKLRGRKRSPETRARLSAALLGHKHSSETLAKILQSRIGFRHTPEARAKMSATRAGKSWSPDALAKRTGWKHTPEARAKIAASNARRRLSPETRAKISATKRGLKECLL